jgi:hypothetical protein
LHLLEKVNIIFPAGCGSWIWRIWCVGVQLKYMTGRDSTQPWMVWSRSMSVNWTLTLWDLDMIPWLVFGIYSFAIKSKMLNRCSAIKWLIVVQQPFMKWNKYPI